MKYHQPSDLISRWKDDILPGLIEAEENRAAARAAANQKYPTFEPRHDSGNRNEWQPVDDNPWGELVDRKGRNRGGKQIMPATEAEKLFQRSKAA